MTLGDVERHVGGSQVGLAGLKVPLDLLFLLIAAAMLATAGCASVRDLDTGTAEGADAARLLGKLKQLLADPQQLLLTT
mgnify:CR=1 FL=1